MSFGLLQSALLLPIEATLNRVLSLDPASQTRLQALVGRTLAIQVTQPNVSLYIHAYGGKLHLSAHHEGETSATLVGPATALLRLVTKGEALSSLQGTAVELRGDIGFTRALQQLLLDLNIDWEFHLSHFIGDIPTQLLHDGLAKGQHYAHRTKARVAEDVQNFLKEESGLLPTPAEVENFYSDVQALVLRLDRFEARLQSVADIKP